MGHIRTHPLLKIIKPKKLSYAGHVFRVQVEISFTKSLRKGWKVINLKEDPKGCGMWMDDLKESTGITSYCSLKRTVEKRAAWKQKVEEMEATFYIEDAIMNE